MRVAVISDPHGDLLALSKVIADVELAGPIDEVLLGGDLAQGGPQPAEVIDEVRRRGWRSVRGNSDEFLIRIAGADMAGALPKSVVDRGAWSAQQLGRERIEYLRSLPTSIELGPFPFGKVTLVHATPWSTEEVVLPDAADEVADRMVRESSARLVVYGHIHTQYQRRVHEGALVSVGAVSGSNDADPRPAYTILSLGMTISVEPRRVDWPDEERQSDYARAGIARRFAVPRAGQFPVRCRPGIPVTLWP